MKSFLVLAELKIKTDIGTQIDIENEIMSLSNKIGKFLLWNGSIQCLGREVQTFVHEIIRNYQTLEKFN